MSQFRSTKAQGEIRQSQVVSTFGPGSMVDLPNHAALIGGLDHWTLPTPDREVFEERLAAKIAHVLELPSIRMYRPPVDPPDAVTPQAGIRAWLFPEWFVVQRESSNGGVRSRRLVSYRALDRGKYLDRESRERAATIITNHLRPVFGSMLVSVMRPFHVERYMSARVDAGANPGTVNREWNVLKAILNWGEKMELIEKNPIRRGSVAGFKVADAKLIYFEPEEWRRFIAAFDNVAAWQAHVAGVRRLGPVKIGAQGERRYGAGRRPDSDATAEYLQRLRQTVPIFRALLFTGCRLGEILSLRWLDVDMRRNVVSIVQQKTGKQKTLRIEGEFRDVLLALPRSVGAAPVFTRPDGRPFATIDVQRAFSIARKLSGIRSELTPHSLRHTFASWLAISGQPLRTIQELLGHADIRMTIRYSHLSPAHLSDAMKTIGRIAEENSASVSVKTP